MKENVFSTYIDLHIDIRFRFCYHISDLGIQLAYLMAANASEPNAGASSGSSRRLAQQQAQVDEVVDIMRQNIDKVLERDKNLSLLDDRADKLQNNAAQFEKQAGKLKRKFWLQNMKMMIIMGVVGGIFVLVVGAHFYSKMKGVLPDLPTASAADAATTLGQGDPLKIVTVSTIQAIAEEKVTTKRPRRRRKKTTTGAGAAAQNLASSTKEPAKN